MRNVRIIKYLPYLMALVTVMMACYVVINDGNASPAYAIIPMIITISLLPLREKNDLLVKSWLGVLVCTMGIIVSILCVITVLC